MGKRKQFSWDFVGKLKIGGRDNYIFKHKVSRQLMKTSSLKRAVELVLSF